MTAHLVRMITIAGLIATALLVAGCDTTKDRSSSTSGSGSSTSSPRPSSY